MHLMDVAGGRVIQGSLLGLSNEYGQEQFLNFEGHVSSCPLRRKQQLQE